jgi:hypothetical protein
MVGLRHSNTPASAGALTAVAVAEAAVVAADTVVVTVTVAISVVAGKVRKQQGGDGRSGQLMGYYRYTTVLCK